MQAGNILLLSLRKKNEGGKKEVYIAKKTQSSAKHISGGKMERDKVNTILRQTNLLKWKWST